MNVVDLFSGCGGMSLGFEQAGFHVVGAFDKWAPAVRIYEENFDHPVYQLDVNTDEALSEIKALAPDVIVGGPPCQDYSIAGKREMGERANLTLRFGELVQSVRPEWVVFENVYNIERFPTLPKLKNLLKEAGYGISSTVIDASKCGVPQKRKRFFLIGKIGESDGFFDEALIEGQTEDSTSVRDALGDALGTEYYYMHPRSYKRRAVFSVDEPAATVRGINRPIPANYRQHPADKAHVSAGVRALTTRERGWLQSFPSSFKLPGAKTDVELAIGNAVPPALARFIASKIAKY